MPLTKDWGESLEERIQADPSFRQALLQEIAANLLAGEMDAERSMLLRYIRATVGFAKLEQELGREQGSLTVAFQANRNLLASDLLAVIAHLEKLEGSTFQVLQKAA